MSVTIERTDGGLMYHIEMPDDIVQKEVFQVFQDLQKMSDTIEALFEDFKDTINSITLDIN